MHDAMIGVMAFAAVLAGGIGGLNLDRIRPEHHRTPETREVVRLGIGMLSILASLVLGLLIASAKTSFDSTDAEMPSYAADLIVLDGTLRNYGVDAEPAREMLLDYTRHATAATSGGMLGRALPLKTKTKEWC
jgi:hypothetical protein